MTLRKLATPLAVSVFALLGAASLWIQWQVPVRAVSATLSGVPLQLGRFAGSDVPLQDEVAAMLDADFHVHRQYRDADGDLVFAYVGYYGTRRGGTPEHTPTVCFAAQGWRIERDRQLTVDAASGLQARELIVSAPGRRELVFFWYRSFRRTGMTSTLALRFDHIVGQLETRRGDGGLVRISTPLGQTDAEAARARLISFARSLEPALGVYWPVEYRPDHREWRNTEISGSAASPRSTPPSSGDLRPKRPSAASPTRARRG